MDYTAIIEGSVKFRDGKKWKSRWCVVRKISPVADCLHLQLYRDSKDRYKQGQTKASLSLQHFLGVESGFTLDKESNTIAILCQDVTVVLAFDTRERLIQWQVKISNNLGEDLQYLVQIGSAPVKTKISPGPARLHIQEYRFSLTLGVPPRLIGVWNISQLRRYGVVENRFCFEGGSGCGRLEGLYVLVTDQGEEITKAFRAASEGKLIPKRKQVSRNQSVASILESPRRRISKTSKPSPSVDGSEHRHVSERAIWESAETNNSSEFGDTVSVTELDCSQSGDTWQGDTSCVNCKASGQLPRSLTVMNTPGTGFNPAWIMEATAAATCGQEFNLNHCCSGDHARFRALSPTLSHPTVRMCPAHRPISMAEPSMHYENYDTPRAIIGAAVDDQPQSRASIASVGELYDTPKKIKETVHLHQISHYQHHHHCAVAPTPRPRCPSHRHCPVPPCIHAQPIKTIECSCHVACACQRGNCTAQPILVCSCGVQRLQTVEPCAIYATVDLNKKSKNKSVPVEIDSTAKTVECTKENERNYANMGFAQSLAHYENVKELRVRLEETVEFPLAQDEDYLMMGPVSTVDSDPQTPPYLPMKPGSAGSHCKCKSLPPLPSPLKSSVPNDQQTSSSASSTPQLVRRREPTTSYSTPEQRRMAQIRRRSNSMDSGRYLDALECITERTASSSTHNTLTPNSQSNSVDSLPSEKSETPKKYRPLPPQTSQLLEPSSLSQVRCLLEMELSRRPSSVPCKSNRDSSSSNDSGVSTGSLKNFGAGFLEFETIVTPLSKVRQKTTETVPLIRPRRSKSSEPLDELSFEKLKDVKSSSAEAEVPLCHSKKDPKDISVSSSSGALTIPYIDSISSSSGASDMSDYIETLSMSSFSSSDHDNQRLNHSAVTILRPRSGKEYQKIDRATLEYGKVKLTSAQHADSPSPGYISSTSSN